MKIKKKTRSNEPDRSNFRVGRGRSRQKICQKFLRSREKEKRDNFPRSFKLSSSFATRWSLLYIVEIVVESDDSFLYEPCSTLGKLELTCYFSCKDIGAFSPLFSSFGHFLRWIIGEERRRFFQMNLQFASLFSIEFFRSWRTIASISPVANWKNEEDL